MALKPKNPTSLWLGFPHPTVAHFTLLFISFFPATHSKAMVAPARPFKVVIDPGHGGSDEGTVYRNGQIIIAEKDIALSLGLEVAQQLRKRGFQVTLTRRRDQDVSLPIRTALANRIQADAFISIHTNSSQADHLNTLGGVETYILNNATDASSKRLAHLENKLVSSNPNSTSSQKDQQQDVALILKDLRLDGNLSESKRLACQLQGQIASVTSRVNSNPHRNRGVKQALFYVLLGADMPSVLVEPGFLNSASDRRLLLTTQGRTLISHAIANGIDLFRKRSKPVRSVPGCKVH
jgi:N-acetylmuramoyl-L-alanine amidase